MSVDQSFTLPMRPLDLVSDGTSNQLPSSGSWAGWDPSILLSLQSYLTTSSLEESLGDEAAVDSIVIRYHSIYATKARDLYKLKRNVCICNSCHVKAAEIETPDLDNGKDVLTYERRYCSGPANKETFANFPHLTYINGRWECPHSAIITTFLLEGATEVSSEGLSADVCCLWRLDLNAPGGARLLCFDAHLETLKGTALSIPWLTDVERDYITSFGENWKQ